jgi:hypothetical protein
MADPLPTLVNEHTWSTILSTATAHRRLIPLGGQSGGEIIDWTETGTGAGNYFVWVADTNAGATGDPYQGTARTQGTWKTIRGGHELVYLGDTPGNWFEGNVLDWVPATKAVHVWRFARGITSGDPLPTQVNQSFFSTIGTGHQLLYLDGDRVLDWEPGTGRARIWQYDRTRSNADPLPTKVVEHTWSSIKTGHQLVYLGGDLLLDWNETSGSVRVWRYDRAATGTADPLPTLAMAEDNWSGKIAAGRRLHYLGGDRVLDWDPATGHERIWDFDRPMMPAADFQTMLNADVATAITWVGAAVAALVHYSVGLTTGTHDAQWATIDAALDTHFHVHSHPSGVAAAVTAISTTYGQIMGRLTGNVGSITQVSKATAVSELGGLGNYTRGYTDGATPAAWTHLTPSYRPLDTIGDLALDGAGPKLRTAIVIHETTHFVGNNPDSALEWQATQYAALSSALAITNPASYATFAHHIFSGTDLRFGDFPWL